MQHATIWWCASLSQTWQRFIGHIIKVLANYEWCTEVNKTIQLELAAVTDLGNHYMKATYMSDLEEDDFFSLHLLWDIYGRGQDNIGISLHAHTTQALILLFTTFLMETLLSNSSTHYSQSLNELCMWFLRKLSRRNKFSFQLQSMNYLYINLCWQDVPTLQTFTFLNHPSTIASL